MLAVLSHRKSNTTELINLCVLGYITSRPLQLCNVYRYQAAAVITQLCVLHLRVDYSWWESTPHGIDSFISCKKVTRNGAGAAPPRVSSTAGSDEAVGRLTWSQRMRALLCCLAPAAAEQYYRRGENEAVVVRPQPHPPAPPLYSAAPVIGPLQARDAGKKTLVLDLDETLVHSSFKPIPNPDYIIPVGTSASQPL